jgi:outer membrane autotransporter protein
VAVQLINDPRGSATYQLDTGRLEAGLREYKFGNGADAGRDSDMTPLDEHAWYLYTSGLSQTADAIIDTAALINLDWHYSLDALHLRMGEVRLENLRHAAAASPSTSTSTSPSTSNLTHVSNGSANGNIWTRTRAYRLNATTPLSGHAVRQNVYGVTAGGDKAFVTETGATLVGGFVDMGRVTRDFRRGGGAPNSETSGATSDMAVGVYGTLLRNDGWHADLVLKADRYRHSFDVDQLSGQRVRGRYNSEAFGVSLEAGRRRDYENGWWVEPVAQVAVAWLGGATYRTTPESHAIEVSVDDRQSAQYRGQVRFGRRLHGTRWTPHGKFGMVRVNSGGGEIRADGQTFEPNLNGWRVEFGAGVSYRINVRSQIYFDYEYGKATAYERPWSLNLGYRHLW